MDDYEDLKIHKYLLQNTYNIITFSMDYSHTLSSKRQASFSCLRLDIATFFRGFKNSGLIGSHDTLEECPRIKNSLGNHPSLRLSEN